MLEKISLLIILLVNQSILANGLDLSQGDKQLHLGAGLIVGLATSQLVKLAAPSTPKLGRFAFAFVGAMTAGFVKELIDGPRYDTLDIQATILGGVIAGGLIFAFDL